jgi:hypothetical protein
MLVPAILVGLRFVQNRTSEINAALVKLSATANDISGDLDEKIQGTAQLHYGLARARDLDTSDKAACSAFLSAVREEYPQFTGILTINPDGSLFCDSLRTDRTLDLRDRTYFKQALTATGVVTLEPVFGRLTGISVLQIAYPVRSESSRNSRSITTSVCRATTRFCSLTGKARSLLHPSEKTGPDRPAHRSPTRSSSGSRPPRTASRSAR